MITFRNSYHDTKVVVRADVGDILSPAQMRRIRRVLCGWTDCQCGMVRGPQDNDLALEPVAPNRARVISLAPAEVPDDPTF